MKQSQSRIPAPVKKRVGLKTGLANPWNRKKISKKACAGRRPQVNWEIPTLV
jgi:hypothetical protein